MTSISTVRTLPALLLFLGLSFAAALFGGQFLPGEWYAQLDKPAWNPPDWIFAPVWTLLFLAIAVAAWLVWRQGSPARRVPLAVWGLQLILNALWSWIFFGLHQPGWAALEIGLLWLAVLTTTLLFWRVRVAAGALFLPYLAWVTFAAALNLSLWLLNR